VTPGHGIGQEMIPTMSGGRGGTNSDKKDCSSVTDDYFKKKIEFNKVYVMI
jgi:hypothetical protein